MANTQRYNSKNVEAAVQVLKGRLIAIYLNGGTEGGIPAGEQWFRTEMRRLDYSDKDIEIVRLEAKAAGDRAWRKKEDL
jgi:hypothetical protein